MDIHNFPKKNEYMKERVKRYKNANSKIALSFIDHLVAEGCSEPRLFFYITKCATILRIMKENGLKFTFKEATKQDIEKLMTAIYSLQYRALTKNGLAYTLKKLVQYAKTGSIERGVPFPEEVSWVRANFKEKSPRVTADKVLSEEEFAQFMSHVNSPRDRAMLYCFYEGAFRPGELLNMKIGNVQFLDQYVVITTTGKTGEKRIPLVISMQPLLEWLKQHPDKDNPEAPLWPSLSSQTYGKALSYLGFIKIVRTIARRAGLNKKVWPYLFRHSRLTFLADKLTESKLEQFAGWTLGSKMTRTYVHFSGRDLDASVLGLYGIKGETNNESILKPKLCPRCNNQIMPDEKRCSKCGLVIDPLLAASLAEHAALHVNNADLVKRLDEIEKKLEFLMRETRQ